MARVALRETAIVTINSSGNATAKVGPRSAREVWYPDNVHISVQGFTHESSCSIYMGSDTTQSNFRDESVFASSGDSSGTVSADVVKVGHYIWAVWSGADVGKSAVLTITGVKDV